MKAAGESPENLPAIAAVEGRAERSARTALFARGGLAVPQIDAAPRAPARAEPAIARQCRAISLHCARVVHAQPGARALVGVRKAAGVIEAVPEQLALKQGARQIVERCTCPLTRIARVKRIYTDRASFECPPDGLRFTDFVHGLVRCALQALIPWPLPAA